MAGMNAYVVTRAAGQGAQMLRRAAHRAGAAAFRQANLPKASGLGQTNALAHGLRRAFQSLSLVYGGKPSDHTLVSQRIAAQWNRLTEICVVLSSGAANLMGECSSIERTSKCSRKPGSLQSSQSLACRLAVTPLVNKRCWVQAQVQQQVQSLVAMWSLAQSSAVPATLPIAAQPVAATKQTAQRLFGAQNRFPAIGCPRAAGGFFIGEPVRARKAALSRWT